MLIQLCHSEECALKLKSLCNHSRLGFRLPLKPKPPTRGSMRQCLIRLEVLSCWAGLHNNDIIDLIWSVQTSRRDSFCPIKVFLYNWNSFTHLKIGFSSKYIGGFQLEFVSISRVIDHMTCYKFECSHWWKIYLKKTSFTRFALQSECCNFNQWEALNL